MLDNPVLCKHFIQQSCKTDGIELTKEEAEAYMAELADVELNQDTLKKIAGSVCRENCPKEGKCGHHVCGTVGWENFKGC